MFCSSRKLFFSSRKPVLFSKKPFFSTRKSFCPGRKLFCATGETFCSVRAGFCPTGYIKIVIFSQLHLTQKELYQWQMSTANRTYESASLWQPIRLQILILYLRFYKCTVYATRCWFSETPHQFNIHLWKNKAIQLLLKLDMSLRLEPISHQYQTGAV